MPRLLLKLEVIFDVEEEEEVMREGMSTKKAA